jgi:hypothetical protein
MSTKRKTAVSLVQLANIDPAALENDQSVRTKALILSRQFTAMLESPMDRALGYVSKVCCI